MSAPHSENSGNVTEWVEHGPDCARLVADLRAERDRLREALAITATGLADASEALDIAGLQVDASDAHQALLKVRETLTEGESSV